MKKIRQNYSLEFKSEAVSLSERHGNDPEWLKN